MDFSHITINRINKHIELKRQLILRRQLNLRTIEIVQEESFFRLDSRA